MPTQVPSGYLEALTDAINALTANAQDAARSVIAKMLADGVTDPEEIVEALAEALEPIFEALTSESASLSATSYDFLRSAMVGYPLGAAPYPAHDPAYTLQAMEGMAAKHKWNMDAFTKAVIDRLDYEAKRAAGQTMFSNGVDDPQKPRFARVPTGAETCPFCIMLASRGFVYRSEKSAGKLDHYHPNCDCRVVPRFGSATFEGYDPDDYLREYERLIDEGVLDVDQLEASAARAHKRHRH